MKLEDMIVILLSHQLMICCVRYVTFLLVILSWPSYQWINSSHCEECPKYPVECPNHCEVGHVRREEISGHLEECPLAIVACPYAAVGCESVVRRKEEMEHVLGSVVQHMEYNKNAILANQIEFQKKLDVKEQELENVKQDLQATKDKLIAKEQELDDIGRNFQATRDKQEQAIMNINKDLRNTINRLDIKENELQNNKRDLQATKQKMVGINKELQATRDRLDAKEQEFMHTARNLQGAEQTLMDINKDLQDTKERLKQSEGIQSQLKTAIAEKGRELDEVRKNGDQLKTEKEKELDEMRKNAEENNQFLQK